MLETGCLGCIVVPITTFDDDLSHQFHVWLDLVRKKGLIKMVPLAKSKGCWDLVGDRRV